MHHPPATRAPQPLEQSVEGAVCRGPDGARATGQRTKSQRLSIPMQSTASAPSTTATCRFCRGPLYSVVDLGMSPLCESFLAADQINGMEPFYPLHLKICADCLLA